MTTFFSISISLLYSHILFIYGNQGDQRCHKAYFKCLGCISCSAYHVTNTSLSRTPIFSGTASVTMKCSYHYHSLTLQQLPVLFQVALPLYPNPDLVPMILPCQPTRGR